MKFDIEQVLIDMVSAMSNSVGEAKGDIKYAMKKILNAEKDSLKELSKAKRKKEISDDVFEREVEREKQVVEAGLLTIEIMTKAMSQKAINAAINVFVKAVKAAI